LLKRGHAMELNFEKSVERTNRGDAENVVSYAELEDLIRLALRAPSGDNCQPWRLTWNDNTLAVFYEKNLGQHALSNNNHATWLSLGCFIEALKICASGAQLKVSETFDFVNWQSAPIAILKFQRQRMKTDALISEIERRKTVRLAFSDRALPEEVVKLLQVEAAAFSTCEFSFKSVKPLELMDYFTFCDEFMWKNLQVAKDFLKWVRVDQSEVDSREDGMPWWTLGIKKAELLPIRIFRRFPQFIPIVWKLGFQKQINQMTKTLAMGQGGLYCIAAKGGTPEQIKEVGRLAYRVWLALSLEGYCVQPLSIPSMTAFDVAMGFPPPMTDPAAIHQFKVGYQKVRDFFGFSKEQYPVWMFRTGKPMSPIQLISTPRVNVHERLKVYTRDQPTSVQAY
jgi:hypothetical protein